MVGRVYFLTPEEVAAGKFVPVSSSIEGADGLRVNAKGVVLGQKNNRVLSRKFSAGGYYVINVGRRQEYLGKILCHTFHGPKPAKKGACIIYLGGKKSDRADQVRWGTRTEALRIARAREARLEARRARSKIIEENRGA